MGRGLLSRMTSNRTGPGPVDEIDSIVEHLRALLNTRQGEAASVPDFGIMDFTDLVHAFPEGIAVLQRSIRATILQFEPRLKNVTVRHVREEDRPAHPQVRDHRTAGCGRTRGFAVSNYAQSRRPD